MAERVVPSPPKGRGATLNDRSARLDDRAREDDGDWLDVREGVDGAAPPLRTTVTVETPRSVITYQGSPDIPFDSEKNEVEEIIFAYLLDRFLPRRPKPQQTFNSARAHARDLVDFDQFLVEVLDLEWFEVQPRDIEEYVQALANTSSPATFFMRASRGEAAGMASEYCVAEKRAKQAAAILLKLNSLNGSAHA